MTSFGLKSDHFIDHTHLKWINYGCLQQLQINYDVPNLFDHFMDSSQSYRHLNFLVNF